MALWFLVSEGERGKEGGREGGREGEKEKKEITVMSSRGRQHLLEF